MPMSQLAEGDVQLSLLATSGHVGLAAEMLSRRYGLSMQYAQNVLEQGYGLLIARLCNADGRQAASWLSAMGRSGVVQPVEAMPPDEFSDVSIRMADAWVAPKLIVTLERLLGMTGLVPASFDGPAGLVVPSLSPAKAEWLCAAIRHGCGLIAKGKSSRELRILLVGQFVRERRCAGSPVRQDLLDEGLVGNVSIKPEGPQSYLQEPRILHQICRRAHLADIRAEVVLVPNDFGRFHEGGSLAGHCAFQEGPSGIAADRKDRVEAHFR